MKSPLWTKVIDWDDAVYHVMQGRKIIIFKEPHFSSEEYHYYIKGNHKKALLILIWLNKLFMPFKFTKAQKTIKENTFRFYHPKTFEFLSRIEIKKIK
jgi:hypothetical protein